MLCEKIYAEAKIQTKNIYSNNQQVVPAWGGYLGDTWRVRFSASEWRYTPANSDYKEIHHSCQRFVS